MTKVFKTRVLTDSRQSWLIMDVPGYSHFGNKTETTYQAGQTLTVRPVYFQADNKAKLNKAIKTTLGSAYWPNLNYAEQV